MQFTKTSCPVQSRCDTVVVDIWSLLTGTWTAQDAFAMGNFTVAQRPNRVLP